MNRKWIILGAIIVGILLGVNLMYTVEKPTYRVLESNADLELREYDPMIVAEVTVKGDRQEAFEEAYKILSDYVSANKLTATLPYIEEQAGTNWKVSFIMPSKYSKDSLPKPSSNDIQFVQIPQKRYATANFGRTKRDDIIEAESERLEQYITGKKLQKIGPPIYAYYNPPWTAPFFRHTEIWQEVK